MLGLTGAMQARSHKSMGPDGLHPWVLRELVGREQLGNHPIYQHSQLSEDIPEDWRLADMTPIYKKGSKEDLGNYRLSA